MATILCLVPVTSLTKWGNVTELNSTSVRPCCQHHVQDRFTIIQGAMIAVNNHSNNGICCCHAPPILRCAGGAQGWVSLGSSQLVLICMLIFLNISLASLLRNAANLMGWVGTSKSCMESIIHRSLSIQGSLVLPPWEDGEVADWEGG